MANRHRGEAAVTIGGAEYRFVFTINAICEVEGAERLPIGMVMEKLQRGFVSTICILVWAGLREHHPEVTVAAARDITVDLIAEVGAVRAGEIIGDAVAAAFPAPQEGAVGEGKEPAGSGAVS